MSNEPAKPDYIKVFGNLLQKGVNLYGNYNDYQQNPEKFKKEKPDLYKSFTTAKDTFNTIKQVYETNKNQTNSNNHNHHNNSNHQKSSEVYYEILESKKSDTNETIKANYKRLIKDFHPDKITGKDLPKAFTDFANQRFKEIQAAYDHIKIERKI